MTRGPSSGRQAIEPQQRMQRPKAFITDLNIVVLTRRSYAATPKVKLLGVAVGFNSSLGRGRGKVPVLTQDLNETRECLSGDLLIAQAASKVLKIVLFSFPRTDGNLMFARGGEHFIRSAASADQV